MNLDLGSYFNWEAFSLKATLPVNMYVHNVIHN